ncbi:hypothetical protein ACQEPB_12985, partial [Novosphingobium fluoreni]|uniref:hypothetical protein n=1 Tax=Novosphingobium fluoreni TaxID=1391222 RepID=UPI003D9FE6B5
MWRAEPRFAPVVIADQITTLAACDWPLGDNRSIWLATLSFQSSKPCSHHMIGIGIIAGGDTGLDKNLEIRRECDRGG